MEWAALVPRWIWQLIGVAVLLGLLCWWDHDRLAAEYERGRTDYAAEMEAAAKPIVAEQGKVTVRVETKYVDRIVKVQGVTKTIVREVPVYVSPDACPLPSGFRVLHDAAAAGAVPNPSDVAHAATVPAQQAAATVALNYGTCHETAERLSGLQEWVREQQKVNP